MGGVHAAMVGSLYPTPVATLHFLSPHSAVVAFCEGVLKHATAWEALREDLATQKESMTLEATGYIHIQDDGYIPTHSVLELQKAWPGSEVGWVTGGHVSTILLHTSEFRRVIVDGLERLDWNPAYDKANPDQM